MNIATAIAILSTCPFVSLARVPMTFFETVLDAAVNAPKKMISEANQERFQASR